MTKAQIKKNKIYSPGLIGGNIVTFLSSEKNTFFLKHEGSESFLKDDDGKYVKMGIDDVIEARQLYLSTYAEQEKENAIQDELDRMKANLIAKATKIIEKIDKFERWSKGEMGIFEKMLNDIDSQHETGLKPLNNVGQDFLEKNPNALEIRDKLKMFLEKEDFESLHALLNFKFGMPMASFKIGENEDLTAFVNLFGAKNIDSTIADLKTKGSLYLEAKVKVEKMYYP